MKNILIIMILVAILVITVSPVNAMIGGELDTEHTNVGAIVFEWPVYDDILARACSGTLIHPRALLTAAHCVNKLIDGGLDPKTQIWVTFDPQALAENATYLIIEEIIAHPDYMLELPGDSHDIALVILQKSVQGIETQDLPGVGYMDGVIYQGAAGKVRKDVDLIIVGYGASDSDLTPRDYPDIHLDATRHVGPVAFQELLPFEIKLFERRFPKNASPYEGDSGGPMFHVDQHGNEVLVGLLGFYSYEHYYRLDIESTQAWIFTNLPND